MYNNVTLVLLQPGGFVMLLCLPPLRLPFPLLFFLTCSFSLCVCLWAWHHHHHHHHHEQQQSHSSVYINLFPPPLQCQIITSLPVTILCHRLSVVSKLCFCVFALLLTLILLTRSAETSSAYLLFFLPVSLLRSSTPAPGNPPCLPM